jgi:hypothetical protein
MGAVERKSAVPCAGIIRIRFGGFVLSRLRHPYNAMLEKSDGGSAEFRRA